MKERNQALQVYVGKSLAERRKQCGLTLTDVAKKIGLSFQNVQKYENARTQISAYYLYQIAYVLGVEPAYFFKGFSAFQTKDLTIQPDAIFPDRSSPLNVLLIEDDEGDAYLTRRACELSGIDVNVLVMHDSIDVFAFLRNQMTALQFPRPDLILLDLNLPKQNGVSILRELKRDSALSDIPVVVLTNSISSADMITCYKQHAAGFICKPFNFNEFASKIDVLLHYWSQAVVLPNRQKQMLI